MRRRGWRAAAEGHTLHRASHTPPCFSSGRELCDGFVSESNSDGDLVGSSSRQSWIWSSKLPPPRLWNQSDPLPRLELNQSHFKLGLQFEKFESSSISLGFVFFLQLINHLILNNVTSATPPPHPPPPQGPPFSQSNSSTLDFFQTQAKTQTQPISFLYCSFPAGGLPGQIGYSQNRSGGFRIQHLHLDSICCR